MTADKKNVLLIGSGGVGTIAAYSLEFGGKASVTAVIRSDYDLVKEKGFEIESCDYGSIPSFKPTNIVKSVPDAAEYGPFDYIVISTKNLPDVVKFEDVITPVVSKNTAILLMQNGIDIGKPFLEKYPQNIVLSGVQMIGSTNYGGKIHHEIQDDLKVGYFENENLELSVQEEVSKKFVEIYKTEHNECVYDPNPKFTRWRKLVYNGTFNPLCTLTDLDSGRLDLFGGVDSIVRGAMAEIYKVAASDGIELPEDIKEIMIHSDDGVYYSPSMLVDFRKGNYMEVEVICGNSVRIAKENNVDAPILNIIYNLLKVVQCKIKESKGAIIVPKERPMPKS